MKMKGTTSILKRWGRTAAPVTLMFRLCPAPSGFDAAKLYGLKVEPRNLLPEILTMTHLEKTPTDN